jgi:hypothetical protein
MSGLLFVWATFGVCSALIAKICQILCTEKSYFSKKQGDAQIFVRALAVHIFWSLSGNPFVWTTFAVCPALSQKSARHPVY